MEHLSTEDIEQVLVELMSEEQRRIFKEKHETGFAIGLKGVGRFRINAFRQRGPLLLQYAPYGRKSRSSVS